MQANIFRILSVPLPNGGLNTIISFHGCPLRCSWCSRPAPAKPTSILWDNKNCLYCGLCEQMCPTGAIEFQKDRFVFDASKCCLCLTCVDNCPTRRLSFAEEMIDSEEILAMIRSHQEEYHRGGEISFQNVNTDNQVLFTVEVLKKCREMNLHTSVYTTGFLHSLPFTTLARWADSVSIDLKHYDEKKHIRYTGVSTHTILANLDAALMMDQLYEVRISLIKGVNDTLFDAKQFGTLLIEHGVRNVCLVDFVMMNTHQFTLENAASEYAIHASASFQDGEAKENNSDFTAAHVRLLRYAAFLRGYGLNVRVATPLPNTTTKCIEELQITPRREHA
ncbi:4Fe-4S binding protein [[Clostridium] aminophilum]|uniref:Pyruvate formate lyase activating enzyme n=1 Tax=[Clostridium] aminophilum TaxID=1526 RepID=A0A1I6JGS5_9FIRM|nr:4Fe-4S binding protein [[Clostridium] aminophilum]MCR4629123.1 4Fe-4S binding protein [Clostridium sp.]SFR77820.1 pyruvate formate lyase activating enzyme [[Clostridium] aminophilum]